jgi:hypothetical protein
MPFVRGSAMMGSPVNVSISLFSIVTIGAIRKKDTGDAIFFSIYRRIRGVILARNPGEVLAYDGQGAVAELCCVGDRGWSGQETGKEEWHGRETERQRGNIVGAEIVRVTTLTVRRRG